MKTINSQKLAVKIPTATTAAERTSSKSETSILKTISFAVF